MRALEYLGVWSSLSLDLLSTTSLPTKIYEMNIPGKLRKDVARSFLIAGIIPSSCRLKHPRPGLMHTRHVRFSFWSLQSQWAKNDQSSMARIITLHEGILAAYALRGSVTPWGRSFLSLFSTSTHHSSLGANVRSTSVWDLAFPECWQVISRNKR